MSNPLSSWSVFGGGDSQSYRPLGTAAGDEGNDSAAGGASAAPSMPGGFPSDEPIIPANRNRFNSRRIESYGTELVRWLQFLVIKPIVLLLLVVFRTLAKILNIIYFQNSHDGPGNTRAGRRISSRRSGGRSNSAAGDPIDKVHKFVCGLEDNLTPEQLHIHQYGANGTGYTEGSGLTVEGTSGSSTSNLPIINEPNTANAPILPAFFQGSYTQALYMATSRAKFLYVYLTNSQNENSLIIFRKIITNPEFTSIFSNSADGTTTGTQGNNALIWGGDLTNPEAYQLANSLNITKFPFLGVLCLTRSTTMTPSGPVKTTPRISLVSKIQGGINSHIDPRVIINQKFYKKMAKYEPELTQIRAELKEKFMSKVLLKQQDMDYEESLARDRRKKQEKLDAKKREAYLKSRIGYFKELEREGSGGSRDKARIAIKLQSGTRKTLYFSADSDIQEVFEFAELCQSGAFDESEGASDAAMDPVRFSGYRPTFKLLSPLPPKVTLNDYLSSDAGVKIRDVECVYPNGLLIIEDL